MARTLWKGWLSFGLVNIPVELHTAVRDHRPKFRMLHATDLSPIKLQRISAHEGTTVAWDELVKGYEYTKGQFVVLTKDDFKAAALEKTRKIDILDFVMAADIDDRYFETPYYLAPGKGGEQAYALLREALRDTQRTGIAKFMLRDTQHLAAIEVIDDALVLTLMRFADELADSASLGLPKAGPIKKAELEMAKSLVQALASEWSPSKYTDEYVDNLMKIINAKKKGKKPRLEAPEEQPRTNVVNLMERLRESLDAVKGRAAPKSPSPLKRKTVAKQPRTRTPPTKPRKSRRAA